MGGGRPAKIPACTHELASREGMLRLITWVGQPIGLVTLLRELAHRE